MLPNSTTTPSCAESSRCTATSTASASAGRGGASEGALAARLTEQVTIEPLYGVEASLARRRARRSLRYESWYRVGVADAFEDDANAITDTNGVGIAVDDVGDHARPGALGAVE